jgi:hypothetical protein
MGGDDPSNPYVRVSDYINDPSELADFFCPSGGEVTLLAYGAVKRTTLALSL